MKGDIPSERRGDHTRRPSDVGYPTVVNFEHIGMCYYTLDMFRCPKRGEYYLSGAVIEAYRAPNDLGTEFRIVRPTFRARQTTVYVMGEPVLLDDNGREDK